MPYCPKCDMEFVEGVTICTDCGAPLLASKEEAMALRREEEARALKRKEEQALQAAEAGGNGADSSQSCCSPRTHVYVRQSQKQEDLKSSAAAFALIGVLLGAAAFILWTGLLPLSLSGPSRILIQVIMTLMAAGCLITAAGSFRSARSADALVQEEDRRTEDIIRSFTDSFTGEDLDRRLEPETAELSPEELSLKRFELIQDILITTHDLPDPSYVDALSEEIYGKLYEQD